LRFAIIFICTTAAYLLSSQFRSITHPTPIDNYVVLANAWLHGHLWIGDSEPPFIDCMMYMGKCYVIEGPMPAVLMLPLVLLFGLNTNQSLVCVFIGSAGVATCDLLLGRMNIEGQLRLWLVGFFGFGTVFWWCTVNPAVWMFAHVACATYFIIGLAEWYGKRRYWLVGVLFACAALTRFPAILAVLPFLYWTWTEGRGQGVRYFLFGLTPLLLLHVAYDFARWHSPFDIGYMLFYYHDALISAGGSPFALSNVPYNLYSYFFLSPWFTDVPPWIVLRGQGVALTLTSPALVLALLAPSSRETVILWLSAALVSIPSLLYYTNGFSQFGMRHSLDFTPFILCLVARGFSRRPDALGFWLIGYSVVANAFGVAWFRI
jgi:hypothetical protein